MKKRKKEKKTNKPTHCNACDVCIDTQTHRKKNKPINVIIFNCHGFNKKSKLIALQCQG